MRRLLFIFPFLAGIGLIILFCYQAMNAENSDSQITYGSFALMCTAIVAYTSKKIIKSSKKNDDQNGK